VCNTPLKVGVLLGGHSEEREVSLQTGKAVIRACRSLGYTTFPIEIESTLDPYMSRLKQMDLVFIALHGGIGENGHIQQQLENLKIPYTGSNPKSSSLCMDKNLSKKLAKSIGVQTADWVNITSRDEKSDFIDLPYVVKPNDQGSTVGLSIVHNQFEVDPALDLAFQYGENIMIETYINGRELTVAIIDGNPMPIVEIKPSHEVYDYQCKYTEGLSTYECPADLPGELTLKIHEDSIRLFNAFECKGYGRIDYLLDDDGRYYFLEMNTLPGMTNTSLVPKAVASNGDSFEDLIQQIIEITLN
jgi:D-alanine-D-alanine ligase